MSEHTPLPWRQDTERSLVIIAGEGDDECIVTGVWGHEPDGSKGIANAEYIVLACNLFPELVAMLEKHAFTELDCPECCCMLADDHSGHENGCRLSNVLARAMGEQP